MAKEIIIRALRVEVRDETVSQGRVKIFDFAGAGVSAAVSSDGEVATLTIAGGGAPTGPAGGELAGDYPNPTVAATHSGSAHHAEAHTLASHSSKAHSELTGVGASDHHNALTIGADGEHSLATQVLSGVAASQTQPGHAELATAAEINTGTDTGRVMPVDQFVASARNVRYFLYRVLDPATSHTVSTTVGGDLELPYTGTITEIGAWVDTAGTTGVGTIDVNLNGTTLMTTTKITLDSTEKSSRTAATAPVLTTTAVTVGDLITVDIDGIQTTAAKGLTIRIGIRQT